MYSQWLNPDLKCNILLVSNNEEALQRQHILEEKPTMNLIESVESQYLKSAQRVHTTYTPTETCLCKKQIGMEPHFYPRVNGLCMP